MKVKELLEKAKAEVNEENEALILCKIKESLKNITSAKKTLIKLEKSHEKLLETDIDDLELEDYDYWKY